MRLDIKLIQNELYMDCYESALASISSYYRNGFEMIFRNTWSFSYESNKAKDLLQIGEGIESHKWELERMLEQYYGIKVCTWRGLTRQQIFRKVMEELEAGYPVLVYFDQVHSPWASKMEKENNRFSGFYMVTGFDHMEEQIYCLDIYYSKRLETLGYINFMEGLIRGECITFDLTGKAYGALNCSVAINDLCERLDFNLANSFSPMRKMAEDISRVTDSGSEYGGLEDLNGLPVISRISHVFRGRGLFSIILEELGKNLEQEVILNYSKELKAIAAQWYKIKALAFKAICLNSVELVKKRIPAYINEVAAKEERLTVDLKSALSKRA